MVRAVLEGVSYSMRDCFEIISGMGISIDVMRACGGGASPLWRQMLADVYQREVTTLLSKEGPALGVALLAGVGTGIYKSVPEACEIAVKSKETATPDPVRGEKYASYYDLYRAVYPALKAQYKTLASL